LKSLILKSFYFTFYIPKEPFNITSNFETVFWLLGKVRRYTKGLEEVIFITDKGPWYNLLEEKGLRRITMKFKVRGYIERFFRYIKSKIKDLRIKDFKVRILSMLKDF